MTIVYLQPNNFFVKNDEMCNDIKGFSFVLFSSEKCVFCKDIIPPFRNLSTRISGCTFAEMNVDQQHQKIRLIASNSSTPINYVPYLLFYVNGKPVARYVPEEQNPHSNFDKMKQFLLVQSNNHQRVSVSKTSAAPPEKSIPEYSIGKPTCSSRNVCYLLGSEAYNKK